jgi:hypothetical protein
MSKNGPELVNVNVQHRSRRFRWMFGGCLGKADGSVSKSTILQSETKHLLESASSTIRTLTRTLGVCAGKPKSACLTVEVMEQSGEGDRIDDIGFGYSAAIDNSGKGNGEIGIKADVDLVESPALYGMYRSRRRPDHHDMSNRQVQGDITGARHDQ